MNIIQIDSILHRSDDKQEVYAYWYACPKCNKESILRGHAYCPMCGGKLDWVEAKPMTTIDEVIIQKYQSYSDAYDDMQRQGVKHLGWVNSGIVIPEHLNCQHVYSNWSGTSCLYVDVIHRIGYSVDMGD